MLTELRASHPPPLKQTQSEQSLPRQQKISPSKNGTIQQEPDAALMSGMLQRLAKLEEQLKVKNQEISEKVIAPKARQIL